MTIRTQSLRFFLTALIVLMPAPLARAGDLNPPPGAVAPSMKTLDEVEPRIAVNSLPGAANAVHRITEPGSYYLTADITGEPDKHGIGIVTTTGVTLDLNGFTLRGVPDSLDGISTACSNNIVIRNGHIRSWGANGIRSCIDSGRIERITASNNGEWGIINNTGFVTHIIACEATNNGSGGIRGGSRVNISDCIARSNSGPGFRVLGGIIRDSVADNNTQQGFFVLGTFVKNVQGRSNGQHGIEVTGGGSRIEGNNLAGNIGHGIRVTGSNNIIICNSAGFNATNYDISAGNSVGEILNVAGATISSSNPWANLSY